MERVKSFIQIKCQSLHAKVERIIRASVQEVEKEMQVLCNKTSVIVNRFLFHQFSSGRDPMHSSATNAINNSKRIPFSDHAKMNKKVLIAECRH